MEKEGAEGFCASEAVSALADRITNPKFLREKLERIVGQKEGSLFISQAHSFYLLPGLPEGSDLYKKICDGVLRSEEISLTGVETHMLLELLSSIKDF